MSASVSLGTALPLLSGRADSYHTILYFLGLTPRVSERPLKDPKAGLGLGQSNPAPGTDLIA